MANSKSYEAASPSGDVALSHKRLGTLLRAFRSRRNIPRKKVDAALQAAFESDLQFTAGDRATLERRSAHLESVRGGGEIHLSILGLQVIADAYTIPRLMLDPLLSHSTNGVCVVEHFDEFMWVRAPGARYLGSGARYRVPKTILAGTDEVAVVHLELEPGGFTDSHSHPGSEMMYVLNGTVEVRLDHSGLRTNLGRGDFIHFYSEALHSARNHGPETAQVLVIRFYQLELIPGPRSSRVEFGEELKQLQNAASARRNKKRWAFLLARIASELGHDSARSLPVGDRGYRGEEIVDMFGLARLLRLISAGGSHKGSVRWSLDELADRAQKNGLHFNRTRIDRLQNGRSTLRAEELLELGSLYDVEPFVFSNFLYPSIRDAIAVRTVEHHNESGFRSIPAALSGGTRARIKVPCRRLADSDIAMVVVELSPGDSTPVNHHPGYELVLPLRGSIEIRFGELRQELGSPRSSYAHYESLIDHCIANVGAEEAEFLVIRFHT